MRMNRKAALAAGASFGMAFLSACSDSPVAPAAKVATPVFAVGDAATSTPVPGKLIVCKAGNIGGDFTVARTAGSGSFDNDGLHLNPGQCVVVAEDGSPQGFGSVFRVHEVAAANVTFVVSGQAVEIGFPPTNLNPAPTDNQDFFINSIHGIRVTYTNTFTPPGCTLTQGFWKTHGPSAKGNNSNEWDLTTITLGTVNYTQAQAQAIFNTPVAGNGLISLAHQLIAAKLNIANGANGSTIAATIAAADALIGSLVVPPVGDGFLDPSVTSALTTALDNFNSGVTGPGHCDE